MMVESTWMLVESTRVMVESVNVGSFYMVEST